jgi:hypothetical protein
MKNLFFILLLLGLFSGTAAAQATYRQWETGYIKPKSDKVDMFEKGLAAHNKKYHNADPYKVNVFEVTMGPHSGSYFVVIGPMTFTQMEGRPDSDEHNADWANNVVPYIETNDDDGYWRQDQDIMYRAPNSDNYGKSRIRNYTLLPGERDRFEAQAKKVMDLYKAKAYPASFFVYWRWGASAGPHVCTEINMDNWSYFDRPDTFAKDFDSVHGEGAYEDFIDEFELCIDRTKTFDELITWSKKLSSE